MSWKPIGEDWAENPYKGPLPLALYRYRAIDITKLERLVDFEIGEEAAFLTAAADLNDLEEARIRWSFDGSTKQITQYILRHLSEQATTPIHNAEQKARFLAQQVVAEGKRPSPELADELYSILGRLVRIACFTTNPLNQAMWSHYATLSQDGKLLDNAGACIEYKSDESWRTAGLRPVIYRKERPRVNLLASTAKIARDLTNALCVKAPEWEYEEEWRVIGTLIASPPFPSSLADNAKLKFEGAVRSLILGLRTPQSVVDVIRDRLRLLSLNVLLKKVTRQHLSDELTIQTI